MNRLTDPAQGYCEMYCENYGMPGCGDPETCARKNEVKMYEKLKDIEGIVPFDRLLELAFADRDGRCVVLPCKKGDVVWRIVHDATPHITKDRCTDITLVGGDVWVRLIGDMKMGAWNFGRLLFTTRAEAEDALWREQE